MRKCKKCFKGIPNRITNDGITHNLQRRKFCFSCSPFKSHNTRDLCIQLGEDDRKICVRCRQNKLLSEFYLKKANRFQSYCKDCHNQYCMDRWSQKKKEAVRYKGGKCVLCGYQKNYAVLGFHHKDPGEKEFDWNKLRLRNWKTILKEIQKCDLVCSNCHGELHNPDLMV